MKKDHHRPAKEPAENAQLAEATAALREACQAIEEHRNSVLGPEYPYEQDGMYEAEAKLYRVLPRLYIALGKVTAKKKG